MDPGHGCSGSRPQEDHTIGQNIRIRRAPTFHEPKCPFPVKYLCTVGIEPPKLHLGILGNLKRDMFELPKEADDLVPQIMSNTMREVEVVKVLSAICKINNLRRNDLRDLILLWEFLSKNYALPRPVGSPGLTHRQKAFLDECEAFFARNDISIENIERTVVEVEASAMRFHALLLQKLEIIKSVCSERSITHGILADIIADAAEQHEYDDILHYEDELPLSFIGDQQTPEEKRPCDMMMEFRHRLQAAKARYLGYGVPTTVNARTRVPRITHFATIQRTPYQPEEDDSVTHDGEEGLATKRKRELEDDTRDDLCKRRC